MTFADLVAGDAVFLDANILVYHSTLDPASSTKRQQGLRASQAGAADYPNHYTRRGGGNAPSFTS
ncbi:MAG TPA: hypothetical protein VJ739_12575 [Gemmataceae bacterium]|nr:hypothetical protein [Gemmataceae bacterium]